MAGVCLEFQQVEQARIGLEARTLQRHGDTVLVVRYGRVYAVSQSCSSCHVCDRLIT